MNCWFPSSETLFDPKQQQQQTFWSELKWLKRFAFKGKTNSFEKRRTDIMRIGYIVLFLWLLLALSDWCLTNGLKTSYHCHHYHGYSHTSIRWLSLDFRQCENNTSLVHKKFKPKLVQQIMKKKKNILGMGIECEEWGLRSSDKICANTRAAQQRLLRTWAQMHINRANIAMHLLLT